MNFLNANKDLLHNTEFSDQEELSPPPRLKQRQCI